MTARRWLRAGLWFLTLAQGAAGLWQLFLPRLFYDDGPWVSMLPPYNEHLMRDVGSLTLAYVLVLAVAAVTMDRRLVRVALAANLVFTLPHFIFHTTHLAHFEPGAAIAQTITLAFGFVIPVVLLPLTARMPARRAAPDEGAA